MVGDLAGGATDHVVQNDGYNQEEAKHGLMSATVSTGLEEAGVENEMVGSGVEAGIGATM